MRAPSSARRPYIPPGCMHVSLSGRAGSFPTHRPFIGGRIMAWHPSALVKTTILTAAAILFAAGPALAAGHGGGHGGGGHAGGGHAGGGHMGGFHAGGGGF